MQDFGAPHAKQKARDMREECDALRPVCIGKQAYQILTKPQPKK